MLEVLKIFAACTEAQKAAGAVDTAFFGTNGCYDGGITGILAIAINILMILIGAGAVIGIVVSGIQYSTAAGDPAMMTKAKRRIVEILIGLAVFSVLWAFAQWLIPGGVLHGN